VNHAQKSVARKLCKRKTPETVAEQNGNLGRNNRHADIDEQQNRCENLAWTALAGSVLVMVLARRDTHEVLKLVDWHLLVFFAALFVVVDGLSDTGLPDAIYSRLQPVFGSHVPTQAWNLTWFSVAGSNIFSNVPFVLVAGKWINRFAEPELMWKVLALATTFAGNLTIIGSVANMIVVESAREHLEVSFWDYARFGIPITILTTVAGVAVLLLLR